MAAVLESTEMLTASPPAPSPPVPVLESSTEVLTASPPAPSPPLPVLESSTKVLTASPPAAPSPPPINNGVFRSDLLTAYEALRSPDGLIGKADLMALLIGGVLAAAVLFLALLTWRRTCGRLRLRCQSCLAVGFAAPDDVEGAELLYSGLPRSDGLAAGAPPDWKAPPAVEWSLSGKVALVTGGSKGLGRAIVEELLKHGCEVLTCARDLTPLAALVSSEPRCVAVQADVATAEGRQKLLALIARRYSGNLDILVNNVGTNLRRTSASHEYTDAEYDLVHTTNQSSAFHLTRQCYAALKKRKGSVVNVSSVSGSMVDNTGAPYAMTKAALEQMTRYLACEWGPDGVRVNAVAPWFISTPLTEPFLRDSSFHAAVKRVTPLGRVGEPHEVACVVAFLAMPAAGYITGQVLGIDGAMMQEGFRYESAH
eukprot:jgi/Chrpa1/25845/Chrysochromulina_OHIO_Genome00008554-RA